MNEEPKAETKDHSVGCVRWRSNGDWRECICVKSGPLPWLTDEALDRLEGRMAADSLDRMMAIIENPDLTDEDYVRTRRADLRAALAEHVFPPGDQGGA